MEELYQVQLRMNINFPIDDVCARHNTGSMIGVFVAMNERVRQALCIGMCLHIRFMYLFV